MDIITIEGEMLDDLLDDLGVPASVGERRTVHRLRVAYDVDGVKFKLDEGVWSPPYPVADEDVRRRGGAAMSGETHELWTWNAHCDAWFAVAQGTAMRFDDLVGSAFTVTRRGVVPAGSPETLGVEAEAQR